jgi:hypothetical protein
MRSQARCDKKPDPIFSRVFRKLYTLPCWNVKPGCGSFLTFEFGQPHLEIDEPREPKNEVSPKVRRWLASRRIYVHGDWHLWIYGCDWFVSQGGKVVADCTSRRRIQKAADTLDGQKLVAATIIPRGSRSIFEFDLGGRLETKPYDRKSEQWMLFTPSGRVLTLRADRMYSYHPGDKIVREEDWKPIQTSAV